jgi:hypothetical protein
MAPVPIEQRTDVGYPLPRNARRITMDHKGFSLDTAPPYINWENVYGDGRAVIDGTVRVVFYLQQFLVTGLNPSLTVSNTAVIGDRVDLIIPIMDGPSFFYSRMQMGAPASVEIPALTGFTIQVYYVYVECGNINPAVRNDFKPSPIMSIGILIARPLLPTSTARASTGLIPLSCPTSNYSATLMVKPF